MSEMTFAKIAITEGADEVLSRAVVMVNEGFDGGRVTKADLASWLIAQAAGALDISQIDEIRRSHFNQVAYLENLVRKLKSSGRDSLAPDELATLQALTGQPSASRKRHKTPSKESQEGKESIGST